MVTSVNIMLPSSSPKFLRKDGGFTGTSPGGGAELTGKPTRNSSGFFYCWSNSCISKLIFVSPVRVLTFILR